LGALFFGRDDRDYYQTVGGELLLRPGEAKTQWFDLRLFGEHQHPVNVETDFSVREVFKDSHQFDVNRVAARADQVGANLTLRVGGGQNPAAFRWNASLNALGSVGTFDFSRESLTLGVGMPLPFKLVGALEVAGGTSTGFVPLQSQWYLGGVPSLRGYEIGETVGTSFWRGRGEIGTSIPLARLTLFSDVGWAGPRNNIAQRASLWSVGAGVSFMDGLVRIDLARALRGDRAWRLHVSADGIL
jgi:hemolysin activation/secretion protein